MEASVRVGVQDSVFSFGSSVRVTFGAVCSVRARRRIEIYIMVGIQGRFEVRVSVGQVGVWVINKIRGKLETRVRVR